MLERSGAAEPEFLPHIMLRAGDVMQTEFPVIATQDDPIREAGLGDRPRRLDLVPIVDDDGALIGVVTERALARRYIRESRETLDAARAPTYVHAVVDVLEGELVVRRGPRS